MLTPREVLVFFAAFALLVIAAAVKIERHTQINLPAFVKPSVFEPALERRTFADL